ncbi:tyrosine-type recombinase/integrase [Micromonospora sp. IBHARD004]|uniref:tyrosine-type recombinase/integrase n=1 Tax=Micromonospora sp. IBHARD004 TaxID=3457764 RepID=UPI00405A2A0B
MAGRERTAHPRLGLPWKARSSTGGVPSSQWQETGLVFTTATGRHVEPRNLNTAFGRLIARADVRPIRFHDLRHSCAILLLAAGVSPRVAMDILGRSQIGVTMNIYGHVVPAMQQEAVGDMNAARTEPEEERGDDAHD